MNAKEIFYQTKSLKDSIVNHVKNNFNNVSDLDFNNRINICKNCDFFNSTYFKCNKCGCFLNIKAKWASEKCPLDKWQATNPAAPPPPMNPAGGNCGCNKKNV